MRDSFGFLFRPLRSPFHERSLRHGGSFFSFRSVAVLPRRPLGTEDAPSTSWRRSQPRTYVGSFRVFKRNRKSAKLSKQIQRPRNHLMNRSNPLHLRRQGP